MSNAKDISRRDLVKGAGLATAAVAAGTMAAAHAAESDAAPWDLEADVVVVGFGGAGASAAIEAADAGASVILLEKSAQDYHLSNTCMAGGGFYAFDEEAGDVEALKQYMRAMFSGDNIPTKTEGEQSPLFVDGIVDKFVEGMRQTMDFLEYCDPEIELIEHHGGAAFTTFPGAADCGFKVVQTTYTGSGFSDPYPDLNAPKDETASGLAFMNCLKNGVEDHADAIEVLWETPAQRLVTNEEGAVVGVVALQGDAEVRIKAKRGVVLASGGYEYNPEMRRAFLEGPGITGWAFYGTPNNTGDGIRMGMEVGAQLAKVGKAASRLIWCCPDVRFNGLAAGANTDSAGSEGTIVVNAYGERFMNEELITKDPSRYFSYKNAVHMDITTLEYPNIPAYMIVDETKRLAGPLVANNFSTTGLGVIPWDDQNQIAIDNGWLIKADTIEELAEKIRDTHDLNLGRMDPAKLAETMEKYAKMVETGEDPDFGREAKHVDNKSREVTSETFQPIDTPPFYALPLVAGGPNTKGGLQCDGDRRVVDWSNEPIARLYTAGEMSSCLKFVYQGGGNLTECLVCGRIAGANAAAQTPWDE